MRADSAEEGLRAEWRVMLFAEVLARSVAADTIWGYIAGVRSLHINVSGRVPWDPSLRLPRVLRGIKRRQMKPVKKRAPITLALLLRWRPLFDLNSVEGATLWAALLIGFFGLLRKSEFTVSRRVAFDPLRHMTRGDVMFLPHASGLRWELVELNIKFSKTEQFGTGYALPIGWVGGPLCPMKALWRVCQLDPAPASAPLLRGADGRALSSEYLASVLAHLVRGTPELQSVWMTLHSLRVGGACALQEAGASELVLQLAGRWRSDAYKAYLRFSRSTVVAWAKRMAGPFGGMAGSRGE
jgi:hypothetical protein